MKKKATIYDIAEKLHITVSTVSRALNDSKSISKKTKEAVWEIAKQLDYTPNKLAASLKSGKTGIIGVMVPSTRVRFFASVIHNIENILKTEGYTIVLVQNNENVEDEIQGIKTLLEIQVDGIIASLSLETQNVNHFEEVLKKGKSLILFDRTHKNLEVPSVSLNDFKAGYMACVHLIEQGFNKIWFVVPEQTEGIFRERQKGYTSAMQNYNLAPNLFYSKLSIHDGEKALEEILKQNPEAIIAGDDFTALGILQKIKEKNKAQIAVIGFANEIFSEFISPSLTTIEQQPELIGSECARLFLESINNKNTTQKAEKIIIEPQLIIRESSFKKG